MPIFCSLVEDPLLSLLLNRLNDILCNQSLVLRDSFTLTAGFPKALLTPVFVSPVASRSRIRPYLPRTSIGLRGPHI